MTDVEKARVIKEFLEFAYEKGSAWLANMNTPYKDPLADDEVADLVFRFVGRGRS